MAQITLKKLAELSGLSIRTVSRVLKDQANVIPEKRELVLELARKYHYQPNIRTESATAEEKFRRHPLLQFPDGGFPPESQ